MQNSISVLKQTELCGQQFSVYGTAKEPLFKAKDVALMLGLSNHREFVNRVDEEERCKLNLPPQGETWMLSENGLYEVLMQSRKPIAKQFKKGVKAILKEIRQSGGYISTQQEDTPELIMARALQVAQTTIERHKQQLQIVEAERDHYQEEVKALAPKAEYTDNVLQSTSTYTMTQVAKELGFTCAAALCNKLKAIGVMFRQSGQWMLTAKYCGKDLTKTRTHHYTHSDGRTGSNTITVFTEKGRMYLHSLQEGGRL